MVVFSLLEPISSLYHNGFTVIPCWSHCALPVCDIGPENLQVVGITVTVRKFRSSVLCTSFYQLIGNRIPDVFHSLVVNARVRNGLFHGLNLNKRTRKN